MVIVICVLTVAVNTVKMKFRLKVTDKALCAQSRKTLANIIHFMRQEAEANTKIIKLKKVQQLVCRASGVYLRTIM